MWNEIPHLNSFRARDQDRGLLGISRSKFASVNHLVQSPCQRRRWQADQKDQPLVRSTDTGRLHLIYILHLDRFDWWPPLATKESIGE